MIYDFDEIIERKNTNSAKYDAAERMGLPDDLIPLWLADMDFKIPNEVAQAVIKTAEHGIYGYPSLGQDYYDALSGWFSKNFGYPIKREWVIKTPGVVFAISTAIRVLTEKGDPVLIQNPVYYPFTTSILDNERKLINNPLVLKDGKYTIDFEDFEEKLVTNKVKLFILCSPHNPVGRVWTKEELLKLAEICLKHKCTILSDEIHCDFVYPGHRHYTMPSLSPEIEQNTILCTAPSKTFNLAGLQVANIIIPNEEIRKKMTHEMNCFGIHELNVAGLAAGHAAYKYGEDWLCQLRAYLKSSVDYIRGFLREHIPNVSLVEPEGTYLVWLDFRNCGIAPEKLDEFMVHKAKLWLDGGDMFGKEGLGFQRFNIACPRRTLVKAFEQLCGALNA